MLLLAQDFNNYQSLRSSGEIPDAFTQSSSAKYEEAITVNSSKTIKNFHLKSNFGLDELLKSGEVLFNDPISKYVSSIADEILKDDPETRKKLSFYTIKAVSVNAFATDRGEIFVNAGLLAHLNSEAELAFILCHEIQHFVLKHNLNSYVYQDKLKKNTSIYKRNRQYDRVVSQHSYTRNLENEADEMGLKLFLKSKYSISDIAHVFDVLGKAHTTHSNEPFDYTFLETDLIKFHSSYKLKKVNPIVSYEEDDDELSTHPSVKSRREKINGLLKAETNDDRKSFIVSEAEFNRIQKIAIYELCDVLLKYRSYPAAIYHAFLVEKKYEASDYTRKIIIKALYGYAQYRNAERMNEISSSPDSIQGEMQHVFYLLKMLNDDELSILAARHCYDGHKKYPKDLGVEYMTKDMVEDVIIYAIESPDDYFKTSKSENSETVDTNNFAKSAFIDIWEEEAFKKMIENGKRYKEKFDKDDFENMSNSEAYAKYKKLKKKKKKEKEVGLRLGIDSLLFINPAYITIDGRKNKGMKYIESEQKQLKYKEWIMEFADKLDLDVKVLDKNHINSKTTAEAYNDIVLINNWVEEVLDHNMFMICSNYNEILPIVKKYNATKFVYTGAFHVRSRKNLFRQAGNVFMLGTPLSLPYGAYHLFKPKHNMLNFTLVLDFDKHTILMSEGNYTNLRNHDATVKTNLYWSMLQMKRKKKK